MGHFIEFIEMLAGLAKEAEMSGQEVGRESGKYVKKVS